MHPLQRRPRFARRAVSRAVSRAVPARLLAVIASLVAATGCSAVTSAWVRPVDEEPDGVRTVRLAIVTAPLPEGLETVGRLWSAVARRYVENHRAYLVPTEAAAEGMPGSVCTAGRVDAVLHLRPLVVRRDRQVRAAVSAVLWGCRSGATLWRADADGRWPTREPRLTSLAASYADAFGGEVRPYVPATIHLLHATLATLPHATLPHATLPHATLPHAPRERGDGVVEKPKPRE